MFVDFNTTVTVVGAGLGIASFIVTMVDRYRRTIQERMQAAHGVSGEYDWRIGSALIRNDGPLPVVLTGTRLIKSVRVWPDHDPYDLRPLTEASVALEDVRLLRPGEEINLSAEGTGPDGIRRKFLDTVAEVLAGAVPVVAVSFRDQHGREWEACQGQVTELAPFDTSSRRFKRHLRLERKTWARSVEGSLMRKAVLEAARKPGGPVRWARLLDWWYGWRNGTRRGGFPLDQPRAWRYADLLLMTQEPHLSRMRGSRPLREGLVHRRDALALEEPSAPPALDDIPTVAAVTNPGLSTDSGPLTSESERKVD